MHIRRHREATEPIAVLGAVSFPYEWIRRSNFVRYYNSRYVGNRSRRTIKVDLDNLPPNLFPGINSSLSRQRLFEVGLFDERMGRGQDGELAYRLWKSGLRLVYDPRPALIHYSPEMVSLSVWLSKFMKAYRTSIPILSQLHPEYVDTFCHWFLERPCVGKTSVMRNLIRLAVRAVCHPPLARSIQHFLERRDGDPKWYVPLLFQYVITTACLATVQARECEERLQALTRELAKAKQ